MARLMEEGLSELGYLEKYRGYREWLQIIKQYFGNAADPYGEGTWIAAQLWKTASAEEQARTLMESILREAVSGRHHDSALGFIAAVTS